MESKTRYAMVTALHEDEDITDITTYIELPIHLLDMNDVFFDMYACKQILEARS